MSIDAISGISNSYQVSHTCSGGNRNSIGSDGDGDNDSDRGGRAGSVRGGGFMSAIMQSLSQLDESSTSPAQGISLRDATNSTANASSSNASGSQAALHTFMHDLFAVLHSQGVNGQGTALGTSDGTTYAPAQGHGHHHHDGGSINEIEGKLQNLIQQLSSSGSTQTDTSTATPTAANSSETNVDSSLSTLQSDFKNVLSSMGISGDKESLSDFLKSVSQNLQGSSSGLNINIHA